MTVSTTVRKAGPFAGTGAIVPYPFAFKVFAASDMVVVKTASGVESTLTLTTHYTVALNGDQDASPGGTVTLVTALAVGEKVTLTSSVPNTQPVEVTNQGGFYPDVFNDALDRLTIQSQQLAEQIGRCVKVGISSSSTPDDLLEDVAVAVIAAADAAAEASVSAASASASSSSANGSMAAAAASAVLAQDAADDAEASAASMQANLAAQTFTAFTTTGSAGSLLVDTMPDYGALAGGQRMRIKFSAGSTGADTLNRDGTGAKLLKQYDAAGAKVAARFAANQLADVEYDGTDYVVLGAIPPYFYEQYITNSGVWNKPANIPADAHIVVELWGAGGGAGARATTGNMGGGGGGAWTRFGMPADRFPAGVSFTIGAGGNSPTGTNAAGSAGGATSVDSMSMSAGVTVTISAAGGGGGGSSALAVAAAGGTGGAATAGFESIAGAAGGSVNASNVAASAASNYASGGGYSTSTSGAPSSSGCSVSLNSVQDGTSYYGGHACGGGVGSNGGPGLVRVRIR